MPDPARIAQAKVQEIPVTIQGTRIVEGTEHRELFTETTKTTLTLENGAMLNLQARVAAGQSVFLRNDQSGREVLCRVVEAPAAGQTGHTDLEFTVHDPEFWEAPAEAAQPATEQAAPAAQPAATENTLAMMSAPASTMTVPPVNPRVGEELVPAYEAVTTAVATATPEPSGPPHEETVPAHSQPPQTAAASSSREAHREPEFDQARFEATLAALLEGDSKRVKRAVSAKEKEAAKPGAQATQQGAVEGEASADGAEAEVVPIRPSLQELLTTGKGAIIVEIAAAVVIAVCIGFIWRAIYAPFAFERGQVVAASSRSKPNAPTAISKPVAKPASTVAGSVPGAAASPTKTPGQSSGAMQTQTAMNGKQPVVAQVPTAKIRVSAATTPAGLAAVKSGKPVASALSSARPEMSANRSGLASNSAIARENLQTSGFANSAVTIPAKAVSEVQPALPGWAKDLGLEGVVKLDAVIDEKGNVTETKVLSGPRPLQHAAQQAVGLWIFQPAVSGGKPVATHMILTVDFQQ